MSGEATLQGAEIDEDQELVSALIGDDDNEEDSDNTDNDIDQDESQPEKYTVKINGVEKHVTKDELIAHYQKGEASHEKFEEAAAIRREVEAQKEGIKQHQNNLQEAINHFVANAQKFAVAAPDIALAETNPHEYLMQQAQHNKYVADMQQAQQAQNELNRQKSLQENENLSAHLAAEKAKLTEVIPEWKDEKVRDKEAPEMATYLRGIGKTAEEINAFNNSTAANFKIVRDAMKYAQLMEKVGAAKSKKIDNVTELKPVSTVGGNSMAKKSPAKMTDKEFADWRRSQIRARK